MGKVNIQRGLWGIHFSYLNHNQTLARIQRALESRAGLTVVTPNADIVRQTYDSAMLKDLVNSHDVISCDSRILQAIARWKDGVMLPLCTGSDLVQPVLKLAESGQRRVAIVGGSADAHQAAVLKIRHLHPLLEVVYWNAEEIALMDDRSGLVDGAPIREMLLAVANSKPDVVFSCYGFPKQEYVSKKLQQVASSAVFLNVGMGLGFFAGERKRSPKLLRRLGLEWLWRLCQEPKRLFKRYVIQGIPFIAKLIFRSSR